MRHARIIGWINGRPIPQICGGSDDNDDASDSDNVGSDGDSDGGQSDTGYPENTPVADMTVEQQAAYWKAQSRKHEARVKARDDYDEIKAKAAELDDYKRQQMTEQERAVEAAREAGRNEARAESANTLVEAEIRVATAGRLTDDQRTALLDGLDRARFLTDGGVVDNAKVQAFVDAIVPERTRTVTDLGQGRREGKTTPSVASGRERYEQRHTKAS